MLTRRRAFRAIETAVVCFLAYGVLWPIIQAIRLTRKGI